MKYARLINGNIVYAPNPIIIDDRQIGNPQPAVLISQGYKPVHQDPYPEQDPPEGYYWDLQWSEDDHIIYGHWQAEPVEPANID